MRSELDAKAFAHLADAVDLLRSAIDACYQALQSQPPYVDNSPQAIAMRTLSERDHAVIQAINSATAARLWAHHARDWIEGRPR